MDFEIRYKEATGFDVGKYTIDNVIHYSEYYVQWLEKQLTKNDTNHQHTNPPC